MTERLSDTAMATRKRYADGLRNPTPEFLAWWDSLTDTDIAAQIADNPDMPGEVDDAWFRRAHKVGGWLVGPEPERRDASKRDTFKDAAE